MYMYMYMIHTQYRHQVTHRTRELVAGSVTMRVHDVQRKVAGLHLHDGTRGIWADDLEVYVYMDMCRYIVGVWFVTIRVPSQEV